MKRLGKPEYIYDIECDGLLQNATKIHCMSICWRDYTGSLRVKSTSNYDDMRRFFLRKDILRIGHNITLYDERVIKKLLGIDTGNDDNTIDTLALSWYLFPERLKHGLEHWGYDLGIHKVEIKDWQNLTVEEYIHRCEEDTKINLELWERCKSLLVHLYDHDLNECDRLIEYLQFKLECVREQEETKIKLDIEFIKKNLELLKKEKEDKENVLRSAMPKVPIKIKKKYKQAIVLENGEFFTKGDMMYDHYFREGYKPKFEHEVEIIKGYKDPNPNSNDQKKAWLYGLGWVPEHFKYDKDDDGKMRKIPQIGSKKKDGSVCDSIKKLFVKEPRLEVLEGLSVISHRIAILEGFLENQIDGFIEPSLGGLTNTLRLKHANIVNLPGIDKKYGKIIRGSLIADDGEILCGSDMSSLEDTTKQHYMYPYDPKYVLEMRTPGFDPHLDIGVMSGLITLDEVKFYKEFNKEKDDKTKYEDIKTKRHKAKTTNFSSIYGVGADKLAREIGISVKEAKKLLDGYWKRNKAVKDVADACIVKQIGQQKWLYNPVSKFWYSLRAEKDRFSTLNQGTGVWCFDNYVREVRSRGIKISLQMHDEVLFRLKDNPEKKEHIIDKLQASIKSVNEQIKLNVPLGISMDFGYNYADCH